MFVQQFRATILVVRATNMQFGLQKLQLCRQPQLAQTTVLLNFWRISEVFSNSNFIMVSFSSPATSLQRPLVNQGLYDPRADSCNNSCNSYFEVVDSRSMIVLKYLSIVWSTLSLSLLKVC